MEKLGRILEVNLSDHTWHFDAYDAELFKKVLSGRGFNIWYLFHHLPPGIDPLGPSNILMFTCGALTGTTAPVSSRLHVNALSPQTALLGSSNVGGGFGSNLRSCNIQSLIIRGRSKTPVYLHIGTETVDILSAQHLWGLDTWETDDFLKSQPGNEGCKTMTIGPGGETGCLFGCIMTDRDHAAGRTGMGTVMGSKNLKAIVIKGEKRKLRSQTPNSDKECIKTYIRKIKTSREFKNMVRYGGAGYVKWADEEGILASYNFRQSRFKAADSINGKNLKGYIKRSRGCYQCPVQCKAELVFEKDGSTAVEAARPEFEPMLALGSKCGLENLEMLVGLDNLCSRLGIDSISAGSVIAFAMDLYERGILTLKDTGDIDLSWGNGQAMETLIRQMAHAEGFGALLSQGVLKAAEAIGRGAEQYAPHVKGLEIPGYHPNRVMGTALGYTVASRGADFNDVYASLQHSWSPEKAKQAFGTALVVDPASIEGKAQLVKRARIVGIVLDCLGICKVPALSLICAFDLVDEAELFTAVCGRRITPKALLKVGERILNLEQLFNIRYGATSADDRLPDMFFTAEYNSGEKTAIPRKWIETMIQEYYQIMGWDRQGKPTVGKLSELELSPTPEASRTAG